MSKRKSKRTSKRNRKGRQARRRVEKTQLNLETLDKREMLDASGAISEAFAVPDTVAEQIQSASDQLQSLDHANAVPSVQSESIRHELVFVDAGVEDQDALLSDLQTSRPGVLREVIHINADSDGLLQIANHLEGRSDIDAIHIISHGEQAELRLGNAVISQGELKSEYSTALDAIGASLGEDADLLIYGCNFGGGEVGEEAVATLSELTGADVAASIDLTGAADKGGDWDLELSVGPVETTSLESLSFSGVLVSQNEVKITTLFDGTEFDTDPLDDGSGDGMHTPGLDGGPNNNVVKTFDTFAVRIDWNVNEDDATGVFLTAELPEFASWAPDATGMFAGCDPATSSFPDDHTLVCSLLDQHEGSNGAIRALATLDQPLDGTEFNVTSTLTTDDDGTGVVDELNQPLVASEAPIADWLKGLPEVAEPEVSQPVTVAGEDGYVLVYPLSLIDFSQGATPTLGAGPINSALPIDFFDHAYQLVSSATVATPAQMTAAGFAGRAPCGAYDGTGAFPVTSGVWTCGATTNPNGYPVVPINVTGHDATAAPATNADGSPNVVGSGINVLTGQIAFWLPADEVAAEIADPDNDSMTSARFENALSQDDDSANVMSQDDVTPILVPGSNAYFPEVGTVSPDGEDPANNTISSVIGTGPPPGGSPGSTIGHDVKFHPGPLQVLETFRYDTDVPRHNIDLRPTTQGGLFNLPGASTFVANSNGDSIGETPRGNTLTIQSQVLTASSAPTSLWDAPIHGCTAFDTTHYNLTEFGNIPVTVVDGVNANTPAVTGGYSTTSNTGPLAHVYTGSATSMWNGSRGQLNAVGGEKEGLPYVVEFTNAPLATVGTSFGAVDDGLTCGASDAGTLGWVDATGDLSMFDMDGDGLYEGITRARIRVTESFPWAPGDLPDTNFTGFQAFFQVEVKADLAVQTVNQELFAVQSHSYGELDPVTEVPDLVPYAGQAPEGDCQPYVVSQWEANGNNDDTATGWCNNDFVDDGANSLDTSDLVDWDNSSSTRSTTAAATGITSFLNSSGAVVSIVEANLGISKTNNDGLGDIKNNGELVEFTISPRVVGSSQEALTNVTLSDNLPANYHFVQFLQMPSTPGASCNAPATPDGTITCQFSEPNPAVDTGALPAGLPGGWSDEIVIQVEVVGAIADPDSPTVITNTASVRSTGLGPWDPAAESFIGDVQDATKTATGRANSLLPLPADEAGIVKAVNAHEGPCELHPTDDPPPAGWGSQCSMIDFEGDMTFTLSLTNEGNTALTNVRFVDVFPHNADATEEISNTNTLGSSPQTDGDGRTPPSDFGGTLAFVSLTGADTVLVSGDDPLTISRDPDRAELDTVWCSGIGGTVVDTGNGTAGSCPATAEDVTATYSVTDGPLNPAETLTHTLTLDAEDHECNDIWTNSFGAQTNEIYLPIRSNDVSVMVNCEHDLALEKSIDPSFVPGPDWITEGSTTIDFLIEITNQGDPVEDFDITDYVDTSVFTFDPANNTSTTTGGTANGGAGLPFTWDTTDPAAPVALVDGYLDNGETVTIPVTLTIENSAGPLENWAEISRFDTDGDPSNGDSDPTNPNNPSTGPLTDEDSTPDADQAGDNQPTGPGAPGDGEIDGVGDGDTDPTNGDPVTGDEDDHDVAGIPVYDLELVKVARDPGVDFSATPWHASYDVTVTNQGNADVYLVDVTEYPPPGLAFDAAATAALWGAEGLTGVSEAGGLFTIDSIPAAGSFTFPMVFDITDVSLAPFVNAAEISAFDDNDDPTDTLSPFAVDVDSTPDATNDDDVIDQTAPGYDPDGDGNVNEPTPGDEDDHDTAVLTLPMIGLAKSVVGTPSALANGNFEVTYELVIENTGSQILDNLQLTEDLEMEFGAGVFVGVLTPPAITDGPADPGSSAPMFGTWDGGLGGSASTGIFDGTSGTLVPGDTITVEFTVEIDPDATGSSSAGLDNTAEVSATNPSGFTVMDDSDSGTDPDSDNPGAPGDMGTADDPTPLSIPDIGVAKQVNDVTAIAGMSGAFDVEYVVVVENTGTVDLVNVQATDDLLAQLGDSFLGLQSPLTIVSSSISPSGSLPNLAATAFDGNLASSGNEEFFDGNSGLLLPGDYITLTFTARVDTNLGDTTAPMDYTNQVTSTGDGLVNGMAVPVSDLSDDGTNPNTDNGTGKDDDPTIFQIPQIRSAKSYGTITSNANGTYTVPVTILVENSGTVELSNLSLLEDIRTQFGDAFLSLDSPMITPVAPFTGVAPTLNPAWTTSDTSGDVIDPAQTDETLPSGESYEFTFNVTVDPDAMDGESQMLMNQGSVSGDGFDTISGGPVTATDETGSPTATDPNGVDQDNPAILEIPEIRTAKTVTDIVPNGMNYDVTVDIVLENTGTVDLTGLDLFDDLNTQMNGALVGIVSVSLDDSGVGTGTAPTLNYGGTSALAAPFDGGVAGTDSDNLLNNDGTLNPGEFVTVTITYTIDPTASTSNTFENSATAAGDGPSGEVTDDSDSGTDPNGDNPGEPGDKGTSDDPTPIIIPDVSVAKAVVGTPTMLPNGNFSVTYSLVVQNTGTVDLDNLQLTENLEMEFGAGVYVGVITPPSIAVGPAETADGSAAPTLATWDGGLGASGSTTIFDGMSGTLVPGDTMTVEFTIEIDPDANGASNGGLDNTAEVSATGPDGMTVMDDSDSGTVPNSDNPGEPGDMGTSDDPTPLDIPDIRLAKQVDGPYVDNGDGTWTIPYQLVLENTGTVDLANPSIVDDISSQIGTAFNSVENLAIDATGVVGGTAPGVDATWDGATTNNILDGTGNLAPGDVVVVTFDLVVNGIELAANSPMTNQAEGAGEGPGGPVMDLSDDGDDPNGDNPGTPGDEGTTDDPTPIQIPLIGLAKDIVGSPTQLANGNYSVVYEMVLQNTGTVNLNNLQIAEDLEMEFGVGIFVGLITPPSITAGPSDPGSTAPGLDAAWDGGLAVSGNTNILDGTSGTLVPNDSITIQFEVEVDPDATGTSTPLENTAVATGQDDNGMIVMDDSDDGADANNGEDSPTPLDIPEISLAKQVDGPYVNNGDGTWTIPYQLVLENTGTVDLANPSIVDDISAQVGTAFNSVGNLAIDATGVVGGTAPGVDATWDGATTNNILDGTGNLAPGDMVVVTFDLVVNGAELAANSPMTNQAEGAGDGPGGPVMDLSDDGDDPNSDNLGTPGDTGTTDDPTPIQIPLIGLAKNVIGSPVELANGNFEVQYQLVLQNTGTVNLDNVQITEDLETEFGAGVFVGITTAPVITAGPSLTGSVAPALDSGWTAGLGGSTATGIFDGTSGTLVPNDTVTVTFSVEVDPDANGPATALENTAVASGVDENGMTVMDDSDDGADANGDNPGEDGDMGTSDDPTPLDIPDINAAKETVGPPIQTATNPEHFDVTYQVVVENTGNVTLDGLDLFDDIATEFGGAYVAISGSPTITANTLADPTNLPTINAGWDANTALSMFNDDGSLLPGETVTIQFVVTVDATAADGATLLNQVNVVADDPFTGAEDGPSDLSDDGSDTTSNNDGSPGDMGTSDDPTPVVLPNATIGVAKDSNFDDTTDTGTYTFYLEHFGNTQALNLSMTENLDALFGAGNYTVAGPTVLSGPSSVVVNSGYDGSADVELLDSSSTLLPGETAVIEIEFTVLTIADPAGDGLGIYNNQVTLTSEDLNGNIFTDASVDGTDPDPGGDGNPANDDSPSDGVLTPVGYVAAAKTATPAGDASGVVFDFFLEHIGNTPVSISLIEDLAATFITGGTFTVVSVDYLGGSPTVTANGMFNGTTDQNLLAAGSTMSPGETAQIQVAVELNGVFGTLDNQATAIATDSSGQEWVDLSQDGTDPNPDGDLDPTNNDDPTQFVLGLSTIEGTTYVDLNNDGIQDPNEVGIPGVTIVLTGTDVNGNPIEITTVTDADGNYIFDMLPPGNYTLTQIQPESFFDGQDTAGDNGTVSANNTIDVVVTPGINTFPNQDFGELGLDPSFTGKDRFLASNQDDGIGSTTVLTAPSSLSDLVTTGPSAEFQIAGRHLILNGLHDDDTLDIQAGTTEHVISINQVEYRFDTSSVDKIQVFARGGNDRVTVRGSELDDRVVLMPNSARLTSSLYDIEVKSSEFISAYGGGGQDSGFLVDSEGRDVFVVTERFATMRELNNSYKNELRGFEMVTGNAINGGYDLATIYDTSADDFVKLRPGFAQLFGDGMEFRASGFDSVETRAVSRGNDRVEFIDSVDNDVFLAEGTTATMVGGGFRSKAFNFENAKAIHQNGGNDVAQFHDTAGDDEFTASVGYARMNGTGYRNEATGFSTVNAYAQNGGEDRATLTDSTGDDIFVSSPTVSSMRGNGYLNRVEGFEIVSGVSTAGGNDTAYLHDSAGDDTYVARPTFSELRGDGFTNRALNFETVYAKSDAGGEDIAVFYGGLMNERFIDRVGRAQMHDGPDGTYRNVADNFEAIQAHGGEGDVAEVNQVAGGDLLTGRDNTARLSGSRSTLVKNFDRVQARSEDNATSDIDDVEFIFEQFGTWRDVA